MRERARSSSWSSLSENERGSSKQNFFVGCLSPTLNFELAFFSSLLPSSASGHRPALPMPALRRGTKPPPRAARQPDAAAAAAAERDDSDGDDDSDAPEELTTAAAAASASASAAAARAAAAALAARERESRAERAARAAERDEERRRKREEEGKGKGKKKTSDGNGDNGDDVEEEGLDLLPQDVLLKLAAARRKGTM